MKGADPGYAERRLNATTGSKASSDPARESFLLTNPDATLGFLLGKGVEPQDILDIVQCWWTAGHWAGRRQ